MGKPHKHAEVIKAWADGADVQVLVGGHNWSDVIGVPQWDVSLPYRVKPKPDYVMKTSLHVNLAWQHGTPPPVWGDGKYYSCLGDFEVLMDGETGSAKSIKVLK